MFVKIHIIKSSYQTSNFYLCNLQILTDKHIEKQSVYELECMFNSLGL